MSEMIDSPVIYESFDDLACINAPNGATQVNGQVKYLVQCIIFC